jgi:hypothetical protein
VVDDSVDGAVISPCFVMYTAETTMLPGLIACQSAILHKAHFMLSPFPRFPKSKTGLRGPDAYSILQIHLPISGMFADFAKKARHLQDAFPDHKLSVHLRIRSHSFSRLFNRRAVSFPSDEPSCRKPVDNALISHYHTRLWHTY